MKKVFLIIISVGCLFIGWGGYQYYSISQVGEYTEPQKADVIIVLGAAVWPMGPSPALQARIHHSATIHNEGLSNFFILTGGMGKYPPTEAEAMKESLIQLGVDEDILFLERKATNTRENIELSMEIMKQNQWETAIIVTDAFHLKRALLIAKENGLLAYGAPVKNSVLYSNKSLKFKYTLREVVAIAQHYLRYYI